MSGRASGSAAAFHAGLEPNLKRITSAFISSLVATHSV